MPDNVSKEGSQRNIEGCFSAAIDVGFNPILKVMRITKRGRNGSKIPDKDGSIAKSEGMLKSFIGLATNWAKVG